MRRRKKYKLEFLTGIFEEWRFYTTYELVNKVKSKVSEDAFRDIEEIVNSVCAENNICSRIAYGVGIHDGMELYKELQTIEEIGDKIK